MAFSPLIPIHSSTLTLCFHVQMVNSWKFPTDLPILAHGICTPGCVHLLSTGAVLMNLPKALFLLGFCPIILEPISVKEASFLFTKRTSLHKLSYGKGSRTVSPRFVSPWTYMHHPMWLAARFLVLIFLASKAATASIAQDGGDLSLAKTLHLVILREVSPV